MKPYFKNLTLFLAGFLILMASCTKTDTPIDNPPGNGNDGDSSIVNPGAGNTVTGYVLDTKGNPVPNASVWGENDIFNNWTEATTDANGKYTLTGIVEGGWKVYAWKDEVYDNKTYHLRMGMENNQDYDAFAGNAHATVTKNFVWRLQGNIPDRDRDDLNSYGYFGGSITFGTLDINFNDLGEGTVVTVTCTPVPGATLFDGSPATTIVKQFTSHITSPATWTYLIHDIPQSHYNITATCVMNGKTKRLLMGWRNDDLHASIDNFSFRPDGSSHGSYESGLMTQNDDPIYLMVEN